MGDELTHDKLLCKEGEQQAHQEQQVGVGLVLDGSLCIVYAGAMCDRSKSTNFGQGYRCG